MEDHLNDKRNREAVSSIPYQNVMIDAIQVSISPIFYEKLLHVQIPKVQKIQSSHQHFFALLGSVHVKSALKILIKLTTGVNFTNILQTAFNYKRVLCSFSLVTVWVCIFFSKG